VQAQDTANGNGNANGFDNGFGIGYKSNDYSPVRARISPSKRAQHRHQLHAAAAAAISGDGAGDSSRLNLAVLQQSSWDESRLAEALQASHTLLSFFSF
jgi:hypothetical protein